MSQKSCPGHQHHNCYCLQPLIHLESVQTKDLKGWILSSLLEDAASAKMKFEVKYDMKYVM